MAKLSVGDRVSRAGKTMSDPRRRGVVARAYTSMPNGQGHAVPLYAVTWDDTNETEAGYLFLDLEPLALAPTARV